MLLATLSLSLLSAIAVIYTARKLSAGTLRTDDPSRGVNPLTSDDGIQQGVRGHRQNEVHDWMARLSHNVKRGQPAVTESHRERDSDGGSDVKRQRQVWRSGERDPDIMKLQKAFPLAPHFSFPNPQVKLRAVFWCGEGGPVWLGVCVCIYLCMCVAGKAQLVTSFCNRVLIFPESSFTVSVS